MNKKNPVVHFEMGYNDKGRMVDFYTKVFGEKGNNSMEPQMIPSVGLWISAMDTEGNRFSILQPVMFN